jgi:hypothetical protein
MSNQIQTITTRKMQIDFPTVAIIRKGAPKQPKMPGKDLEDKFRVVFEPGMEYYKKRFHDIYGTYEPKVINAMLPFSDISECYEVSNEAYQAGMLVFKAVNGHVLTYRDPETSDYLVRGGEAQKDGVSTSYDPFKKTSIDYTGHDGKQKSLPIRTQTRLKLFIPEMQEFVWFLLKTTSYYDSLNIQNNLNAVQAVASSATGGNVAGVKINVFRAQQDILWNSDGGPRRIKKWLVQVKIDPDWVQKMIVRMSTNTLNAGTQVQQLTAPVEAPNPDIDQDDSDDEIIDGVVRNVDEIESQATQVDGEAVTDEVEGDDKGEPEKNASRPYEPETLKIKLAERAEVHKDKTATPGQRKMVIILLNEHFGGDDDRRHTVQRFLFGSPSLNEVTDPQILAAIDWMQPEQDSGGKYFMCDDAKVELSRVHDHALQKKGQAALF